MFVVAIPYEYVSPNIVVTQDGWAAWVLWCLYSPNRMVTVNKYDKEGLLIGRAEAEGRFGNKVWHEEVSGV